MSCSLLCRICGRLSQRHHGDSFLVDANNADVRPFLRRQRQEADDEAFARRLAGHEPQTLPRERAQSGESAPNQQTDAPVVSFDGDVMAGSSDNVEEDRGRASDRESLGARSRGMYSSGFRSCQNSRLQAVSAEECPLFQSATSSTAKCPICMEFKDVYAMAPCSHSCCVRCATQYIRSALANGKSEVKATGVRCPMHAISGCQASITAEMARDLLHSPGSPGADTEVTASFAGPLKQEELERFERFVVEASLPHGRKVHCPKCERPAAFSFTPEGDCECPYCRHRWNPKAQKGEDRATAEAVRATSKACPNCGLRITHYHGHDCHHIAPGDGCPGCKQHFCYVCLRKHGQPGRREWHRRCTHRQTFCCATRIRENLVLRPFPHDSRCGCPICPDCSVDRPCPQCPGNCVVCRGILPPGGLQPRSL